MGVGDEVDEVDEVAEDKGACGDINDLISTDNEPDSLPAVGSTSKPDILLIVLTAFD